MPRRQLPAPVEECPEPGCDGTIEWITEVHDSGGEIMAGMEVQAIDLFVGLCTKDDSHEFFALPAG